MKLFSFLRNKTFKYVIIGLTCIILMVPYNSKAIIWDIVKGLYQVGSTAAKIYTTAQTVAEIKVLLEQIACAKYKFDKARETVVLKSCINNSEIKLLDIEMSTAYKDVLDAMNVMEGKQMTGSNLATILQRLRSLVTKLKQLDQTLSHEMVEQQKQQSRISFVSAAMGRSF